MDFWQTVMVLVRRWYVTVPAVLLTLGAAFAAYSTVPPDYESTAVLVLTTPVAGETDATQDGAGATDDTTDDTGSGTTELSNPFLNFDRSLALAASIVIQQLNSTEVTASLGVTPGQPTGYEVTNGSSNPELLEAGPFIFVRGHAPTAEGAQQLAARVADLAATVLDERQDDLKAPPSTHIGVQTIVAAPAGRPLKDSPLRAAAAVAALAGAFALISVFGFESLMAHRRRRSVPVGPSSTPSRPSGAAASRTRDRERELASVGR